MIEIFKDDFHTILRQEIGYHSWVKKSPYELRRLLYVDELKIHHCEIPHKHLIRNVLNDIVCPNEMIDIFFKAMIRAETRFSTRFVPQKSHEERLTGNLVSEMGGALELVKPIFREKSLQIYGQEKEVDFFYMDLSRGGKLEKKTGADLALGIIVDLPDFPPIMKTFIFQAKKINQSTQIDVNQLNTLKKFQPQSSAYLFYDMGLNSLSSPMVLQPTNYDFNKKYEEATNNDNATFNIQFENVMNGMPLSAFLCFPLLENDGLGSKHTKIEYLLDNFDMVFEDGISTGERTFSGLLGLISIGRKINYIPIQNNEGYNIQLE